jgi:mannose-6-phosphate isomerase-like protein (cupin superfamily)
LVYWDGIRYAWYHISSGDVLNVEGEKDSYPQAVIPLRGNGKLELDELSLNLESDSVYYIPPNSTHKVYALSDVELIWLAWNSQP